MSKRFIDLKPGDFVLGLQDYNVNPIVYEVKDTKVKENEVYLTLFNKFSKETIKFYGFGIDDRMFYNKMWFFCDYETYLFELKKLEGHLELAKITGVLLNQ